jgi:hypothetical protein
VKLFRRSAPRASCPDCSSTHFLPVSTIHEFRIHHSGADRYQIGYLAHCARCGGRFCVTNAGVYRGGGAASAAQPAPRTGADKPANGTPLRTVDADVASWRGPRT